MPNFTLAIFVLRAKYYDLPSQTLRSDQSPCYGLDNLIFQIFHAVTEILRIYIHRFQQLTYVNIDGG